MDTKELEDSGWNLENPASRKLLAKLKSKGTPLGELVNGKIFRGVLTGLNEAFVITPEERERLIREDPKSAELIKPFLRGKDVKRYKPLKNQKFLIFTRRGVDVKQFPAIERYLIQFKKQLLPRPVDWKPKIPDEKWPGRKPGNYKWYEIQDSIDYYPEFEKPKIIFPAIIKRSTFVLDSNGIYSNDKTSIIAESNQVLIGILNSKVVDMFMSLTASTKQGGYFEYKPMYVQKIPVPKIELKKKDSKLRIEKIERMVGNILELNQKLDSARSPDEKVFLQKQIDATDREIDQLVYQLYDLTPKEIALIEESVK